MTHGRLSLSTFAHAELRKFSLAAFPEEACGLLLGKGHRVERLTPLKNAAKDRRAVRFEIDPIVYADAEVAASAKGWEVLGVFHTHPATPATPSETDGAFILDWPEWVHLIARVDPGAKGASPGEIRAYRAEGQLIMEVPVGVS